MKPLNIHYFQHVSFEGLGCIEDWALNNNHQLTSTKFHESVDFPKLNNIDWLIIMGGPMGIYDHEKYPYLKKEKTYIKKAITAGKTVIGICLGAQLIADVLAATISPNIEKEIGWFDIQKSSPSYKILNSIEDNFPVFHWHGDTFKTPKNAEMLFKSEACKNQGYLFRDRVLGLQFHLEVTETSIRKMVENGKHDLHKGRYIQSAEGILANKQFIETNNQIMFNILDWLNNNNNDQ